MAEDTGNPAAARVAHGPPTAARTRCDPGGPRSPWRGIGTTKGIPAAVTAYPGTIHEARNWDALRLARACTARASTSKSCCVLSPAPSTQDFFWDDLLEYIEDRRVIPIVGAELLTVPDGAGGAIPLQRVLAQKLAERLRVPAEDCTGDDALNQVVCRDLQRGGRREEIYPRLRNLMKELAPAIPEPLRHPSSYHCPLQRRTSARSCTGAL